MELALAAQYPLKLEGYRFYQMNQQKKAARPLFRTSTVGRAFYFDETVRSLESDGFVKTPSCGARIWNSEA